MLGDAFAHHPRREGGRGDPYRPAAPSAPVGRTFVRRATPTRADVRLSLPANAENVVMVRHVLDALAGALDLPRPIAADVRLAVTEACTNVVRHAYAGRPGSLEVSVTTTSDTLEVRVEDAGLGMGESPDLAGPGLGLSLIAKLADGFDIGAGPGPGSRLVMSFLRDRAAATARPL